MTKRYANYSLIYAIAAMVFGVFYREFTKFSGFEGKTNLSVMHTHYFLLGMVFFLILMLIEKNFNFSAQKKAGLFLITYQAGLNITALAFFIRGINQVWQTQLSKGVNAAISGAAGIGHIIMGVSLIFILIKVKKAASNTDI